MSGFEEVPSVSTTGGGQVDAEVNRAGTEIRYTLRYRNLEGAVQQSHIHFGEEHTNGGIVVFLCTNLGNGPVGRTRAGLPAAAGEVEGVLTADDVSTAAASRRRAPRASPSASSASSSARCARASTYANVHSDRWPGGEIRGQFDHEQGHED